MNVHPRVLPFKRISNFRDLGGYPTMDGKSVKWGVLYRSGHLAKVRSADLKRLEALSLHTIIDFRSDQERDREPSRLPRIYAAKTRLLPVADALNDAMTQEIYARLRRGNFQGFDPYQKMETMYRGFAFDSVEQYKQFIQVVLEAQGQPVLWHCTAGKDRTGFAAVILLRLLGVSEMVAIEDYLLSAKYVDQRKKLILMLRLTKGKHVADIIRSFLVVQKAWIQVALQSIVEHWGSFEVYSSEALDLSSKDIAQLRYSYTTIEK